MLASDFRMGEERLGNLGWAAALNHKAREWLEQEATVGAAEKGVRQSVIALPGSTDVVLLLHEFSTALAATVQPVEELELLPLGCQLVGVPLDELEMKFGVELLEDGHE